MNGEGYIYVYLYVDCSNKIGMTAELLDRWFRLPAVESLTGYHYMLNQKDVLLEMFQEALKEQKKNFNLMSSVLGKTKYTEKHLRELVLPL